MRVRGLVGGGGGYTLTFAAASPGGLRSVDMLEAVGGAFGGDGLGQLGCLFGGVYVGRWEWGRWGNLWGGGGTC